LVVVPQPFYIGVANRVKILWVYPFLKKLILKPAKSKLGNPFAAFLCFDFDFSNPIFYGTQFAFRFCSIYDMSFFQCGIKGSSKISALPFKSDPQF
jgi:hypothetical protein